MQTTLDFLTRHRRGAALCAALALTLAAGVTSRALGTHPVAGPGVGGSSLFVSQGPVRLTGELEGTKLLRGGDGLARLELSIAGKAVDRSAVQPRTPTDVVVVLDRSGSMEGEKLERARAATRALLRQLGPQDRFALIAYANDAIVAIPLTQVTSDGLPALDARVNSVGVDGGTNIAAGLDLGLATAARTEPVNGRVARMILISDGMANVGDASLEGLTRRASQAAGHACVVSAIGVGSDFDERVMTAVADAGTGNFYYLDERRDLGEVFAHEFGAARGTVASALQVEIVPAPGVRVVDAAGYALAQKGGSVTFQPGALFDGQDRRIWVTLSVPEGAGEQSLGRFALHYERDGRQESLELPDGLRVSWAEREEEVARAYAPAAWARSVGQEEYGKLEDRVAESVRKGDRRQALQEIEDYRLRVDKLNQVVASPAVSGKLSELKSLEADVNGAFSGENQPEKQNHLAKQKAESSKDARRMGAKSLEAVK